MFDVSALGLNLQKSYSDVLVAAIPRSTAAEAQGWGRVALRCGQANATKIHRKIVMNSDDEWREHRQVEKSLSEIAGKGSDTNMAALVVVELNAHSSGEVFDLGDQDDDENVLRAARLVHAKFTGYAVQEAEPNIHRKLFQGSEPTVE